MGTKQWNRDTDIPNLKGKVAIVTGGNAGIGYAAIEQLARHGAKVYMAARSEKRATDALTKLYKENPKLKKGDVVWLPLELDNLESIVQAAQAFLDKEQRLDILANNAATITNSFQTTSAGFEVTVAVNHLGHFLLTNLLVSILEATAAKNDADVRVVTTSAAPSGHTWLIPASMMFDKIDDLKHPGMSSGDYSGMRDLFSRYAVSKVANVLFAKELQRRFDAKNVNIISTSFNPSGTNTEGGMSVWPTWLRPVMSRLFAPASKGAIPLLYLATASEVKRDPKSYKALFFNVSCKAETPSVFAQDPQRARNLWETSTEAVRSYLPLQKRL